MEIKNGENSIWLWRHDSKNYKTRR
jgi:hypothetical protein